MAAVNIGRLMKKSQFAPLLRQFTCDPSISVIISDESGVVLFSTEGADSVSSYPVTAGGSVIGTVSGSGKIEPLAWILASLAETELEKRALADETLNKYKEITLLYDMVEQVSSCLNRKEVARLVIEQARKVIRLTSISVMLLNRESGVMELEADFGDDPAFGMTVSHGVGIAGDVWKTGRAEIVNDVHSDPRLASVKVRINSILCAPLKAKEEVIGIIRAGHRDMLNYTADDLKLFNTLASLAAVAIENAGLYEQLSEAFYTTIYTLAETIEKRDPYTGNHTKRVMEYSLAIGRTLKLAEDDMTRLKLGAVLHDVGKIGVRDSVLLKESALTDEEFEQIKKHAVYGEEIISRISSLKNAIPGIRHHHERFNGRGYPDGLAGEEIDITARIIAVADSYDAMTTDRPYRKGLTIDDAFEELRKFSGSQFDPEVVEAFFASDIMEAYFTANSRSKIIL